MIDARIHNGSWAVENSFDYSSFVQKFDYETFERQDMLMVFAAGNVASAQATTPSTVLAPSTGKNVISGT